MPFFYISFATDYEFLGGTVVEAMDYEGALAEATRRGLNPGGEAAIVCVPPEAENNQDFLAIRDRLASSEEMMASGGLTHGDMTEEEQARFFEQSVTIACADCNLKSADTQPSRN